MKPLQENTIKNKDWFLMRIGQRVYRYNDCPCSTCIEIGENGIIIKDKDHADYLYNNQLEFAQSGDYLNYRDEKNTI